MERGSIGGSYFVVQLPDGTMEKRLKVNVVEDSVCSCFSLTSSLLVMVILVELSTVELQE